MHSTYLIGAEWLYALTDASWSSFEQQSALGAQQRGQRGREGKKRDMKGEHRMRNKKRMGRMMRRV